MPLPIATPQEIERAAREISGILRSRLTWHGTTPQQLPQIGTNLGTFIFFGLQKPKVVEQFESGTKLTEYVPSSLHLLAVSEVPTSEQRIILLEMVTRRISKLLGANEDALIEVYDPTKDDRVIDMAQAGEATLERQVAGDPSAVPVSPYKSITTPFTVKIMWNVSPAQRS